MKTRNVLTKTTRRRSGGTVPSRSRALQATQRAQAALQAAARSRQTISMSARYGYSSLTPLWRTVQTVGAMHPYARAAMFIFNVWTASTMLFPSRFSRPAQSAGPQGGWELLYDSCGELGSHLNSGTGHGTCFPYWYYKTNASWASGDGQMESSTVGATTTYVAKYCAEYEPYGSNYMRFHAGSRWQLSQHKDLPAPDPTFHPARSSTSFNVRQTYVPNIEWSMAPSIDPSVTPMGRDAPHPAPIPYTVLPSVRPDTSKPLQTQRQTGNSEPIKLGGGQYAVPIAPAVKPYEEPYVEVPITVDVSPDAAVHVPSPWQSHTVTPAVKQRLQAGHKASGRGRIREKKAKMPRGAAKILAALNQATEAVDFVDAVFEGLKSSKAAQAEYWKHHYYLNRAGRTALKARLLFKYYAEINVFDAFSALVENHLEDNLIGKIGQAGAESSKVLDIPAGGGVNSITRRLMRDLYNSDFEEEMENQ